MVLRPEHPRPPVALIITSQEWSSLSIGTLFAPRGYAVLRAYRGTDAVRRATEAPPDLIIIDRDLRDVAAPDLCRALREAPGIGPVTPIIVVGPKPWPQQARLDVLRAGAWEVVGLPADVEEILLRIDTWVRAKQHADRSRAVALLDPHTQLYTAQGLLKRLQELGAGAERHRRALACVILSPEIVPPSDSFPGVFESTGSSPFGSLEELSAESRLQPQPTAFDLPGALDHPTSSALRQRLAAALTAAGRTSDIIALMNDREFVIIAPETDNEGAMRLADRMKRALELALGRDEMPLRIRAGCYAVPDLKGASISATELLVRAARALRQTGSSVSPPAGSDA